MPVKCPDYVGERRKALDEALELMTQELTNIEGGLGRTINFKHCFLELRENLRRLGFFYGPKDSFNFGSGYGGSKSRSPINYPSAQNCQRSRER